MGFFDKFKRKKQVPPPQSAPQSVSGLEANVGIMVLFDRPNVEIEELKTAISQQFGADSILQIDASHPAVTNLMLRIDGMDVTSSYITFPLPEEEGNIQGLLRVNHYVSEEERVALMEHKSFCLLTKIGEGNTLEGRRAVCQRLSKLCGCLLRVDGAAGVYYSAACLLLGKEMYLHHVSILEREEGNPDYFPAPLWILVYQTCTEENEPTVETCGLEQFGFSELQFFKPREEWANSYEKLYLMSVLEITGKELYRNMDTIAFTEDTVSVFKQNGRKLSVIGGI